MKTDGIAIIKIIAGCFLYSLSVVLFLDPMRIIPGSITGIGVVVKAVTGFPIGRLNVIINIPLVIIGTVVLGKRLLIYTGMTVFLTSVIMDGLSFLRPFTTDLLLASVFGGVIMGIGLGLILDGGGTTGGTTIVGRVFYKFHPSIPLGEILMAGDFVIIVCGSVVLRDWDLMLYSLLDLYVCTVFLDLTFYGFKKQSLSFLVTLKGEEIIDALDETGLGRIVEKKHDHLIIASKKSAVSKIERIVLRIDPEASCSSVDADYTYGKRLKQ